MRCGRCGTDVEPGLTMCPECGANLRPGRRLQRTVYCYACQSRVPAGLNICPACGAPLQRSWRPLILAVLTVALVAGLAYVVINVVPWAELRAMADRMEVPELAFLVTPTFTPRPTITPTATRTATRTPRPTATAVPPTLTPTAVPPTATSPPQATATPTVRLVTTSLLAPADRMEFRGGGAQVALSWESIGTLGDDEWYALSLRYSADGVMQYSGTWTKDTSWIVPAELYTRAGQVEREFQWDVTVVQQTGFKPDGGREGVALGPTSEPRTFFWY